MRKFRKRLIALVLAVSMLSSLGVLDVWADYQMGRGVSDGEIVLSAQSVKSTAKISIDSVKAKAGKKVEVPVKISSNPGIAGIALEFTLPKGMKLKKVAAGKAFKDGVLTQNGNTVSWYGAENVKKNGTLLTLTVTAPKKEGTYKIKAALKDGKAGNLCDENGESVKAKFSSGTVKVGGSKTAAKPTVPILSSVKSKGKTVTAKWKKVSKSTGYQIQFSTDKKFKKNVRTVVISKAGKVSYTAKNLKKGTYYVRIRTRSGQNYSGWSGAKKVRIGA